jgi:TfoX/Sxy family transcriptional regulator of competence genes
MAVDQNSIGHQTDQLPLFEEVIAKKVFGGCGLYGESGLLFGMITSKAFFRLRIGGTKKAEFEAKGTRPLHMDKKVKVDA